MKLKLILVFYGVFLIGACTEFQEPQLTDAEIEVLIPRDSLRTEVSSQLFYWYYMEGAIDYELQIAEPDFQSILKLHVDTLIAENQVRINLNPGEYEWRIRAFNNSSATDYFYQKLYIDSTLNLANQDLFLIAPSNNDTTNNPELDFTWQSLYNADYYQLDLAAGNGFGSSIETWDLNEPSKTYTLLNEGAFSWRVRAVNSSSSTAYSARALFLDTTAPGIPQLISPADRQPINTVTVNFNWNRVQVGVSSIQDSIQLSKDSLFQNLWLEEGLKNSWLDLDTLSSGTYFWRVKSIDKAGNSSGYTNAYRFTLP